MRGLAGPIQEAVTKSSIHDIATDSQIKRTRSDVSGLLSYIETMMVLVDQGSSVELSRDDVAYLLETIHEKGKSLLDDIPAQ